MARGEERDRQLLLHPARDGPRQDELGPLTGPLTAAAREGLTADPGLVVESSPGIFEAWLRLAAPVDLATRTAVARFFTREAGGDAGTVRLRWSLHQMLQVLQLNMFERRPLQDLFTTPSLPAPSGSQLSLAWS